MRVGFFGGRKGANQGGRRLSRRPVANYYIFVS